MENKMTPYFPFILLHLLPIFAFGHDGCPSLPQKGLTCYNDYSHNITCIWKSSPVTDQMNQICSIYAKIIPHYKSYYGSNASCKLLPYDRNRPDLLKCSLIFDGTYLFQSYSNIFLNVSCSPSNQSEILNYKPACHVRVNPPQKPEVNFTKVSWFTQVAEHFMIEHYSSQLQWKQKEQIWSDLQTKNVKCKFECEATLVQDWLVQGETYEARVRVMSQTPYEGTWSDWSPTVTWVPLVGRTRLGSGNDVGVLNWSILGMALFGLLLLPGVCFTVLKSTCSRVYFEKIIGSPLPNPAKSAQFNTWLNPYFSSESYHSFLKSVDIVPVEIFSVVDDIILYNPEVKKMPDNNTYESSCSSFSNPGYSHFCSASPGFPFSPGSLGRSAVDASYMNVSVQEEEKNKKQDCDVTKKKQEMVKLLLMGRVNSEALGISDYKNVYKLQAEPQRLHSTDSGMSSYEEVSQWIMEADSIHVIEGDDERHQCIPEDNEDNEAKSDVQKLFEGSVGFLDKNSVISPYKVIPIIKAKNKDLHRLYSVDSGMSSFEEVSQDSIEENSILEMEEHDEGALSREREKE